MNGMIHTQNLTLLLMATFTDKNTAQDLLESSLLVFPIHTLQMKKLTPVYTSTESVYNAWTDLQKEDS